MSRMSSQRQPWIGVDFDGTLAHYESWGAPEKLGPPIPKMVNRVKKLLREGKKVKIFTARGFDIGRPDVIDPKVKAAFNKWCEENLGQQLEVTNVKDYAMTYFYDDRAVQVERNTGNILGEDWEDD